MIAVSDVDVQLPEAQTRNLEGHDRISITLGPNGELAVDEENVARSALEAEIAERLAGREDVIIVIRADQSVAYGAVREIVDAARAAGAARIAVGTNQKGTASSSYEREAAPEEKPVHDASRNPASSEEVKS
jgi:biopolymer transport protein ExbD